MRGLEPSRGTICFIGAATIMPASARAPIAASRGTASNMPSRFANRRKPGSTPSPRQATASSEDEALTPQNSADEYLLMGLAARRRHRREAARRHRWTEARRSAAAISPGQGPRQALFQPRAGNGQRPPRARPADRRARRLSFNIAPMVKLSRRGLDHLRPVGAHFENGEPALGCAVGQEPEQAVDAGKAAAAASASSSCSADPADFPTATRRG